MKLKKTKKFNFNFTKAALWALAFVPALVIVGLGIADAIQANVASSMVSVNTITDEAFTTGMAAIGAGLASIGLLGAGIGQGNAAAKASEAVGRNPEAESKIRSMFIIGAAIAESSALYAFVIAIMLVFVV